LGLFPGRRHHVLQLFYSGWRGQAGWTSYSPIATLAERGYTINGQTFWIIGMVFPHHLVLLARKFIATIIQLRRRA